MWSKIRNWIPGKTSPKRSNRACLCDDGLTYSRKCCKGGIINQGIGNISGVVENVLIQEDGFKLLQESGKKILIDK